VVIPCLLVHKRFSAAGPCLLQPEVAAAARAFSAPRSTPPACACSALSSPSPAGACLGHRPLLARLEVVVAGRLPGRYNTVRFQISYNVRVTNCQFLSWLWTTNIQRHANNKPHIDTGCSNSGSTYMPRLKPLNNTRHYIYLLGFLRATAVKHICIFLEQLHLNIHGAPCQR
jgi:hypothetical protein